MTRKPGTSRNADFPRSFGPTSPGEGSTPLRRRHRFRGPPLDPGPPRPSPDGLHAPERVLGPRQGLRTESPPVSMHRVIYTSKRRLNQLTKGCDSGLPGSGTRWCTAWCNCLPGSSCHASQVWISAVRLDVDGRLAGFFPLDTVGCHQIRNHALVRIAFHEKLPGRGRRHLPDLQAPFGGSDDGLVTEPDRLLPVRINPLNRDFR